MGLHCIALLMCGYGLVRWDLYTAVMSFFVIDVVDVNEAAWQLPCEQREMMEEV